jgi:hypothetical protein
VVQELDDLRDKISRLEAELEQARHQLERNQQNQVNWPTFKIPVVTDMTYRYPVPVANGLQQNTGMH